MLHAWWWRTRDVEAASTPAERLHERASAYLDGELDAAERTEFEAELATSEAVRAYLDDLRLVRGALAAMGTVRAPRSFALLAPPAPLRAGPGRFEWATRAGTGVAALLFVVALANGGSANNTPEAAPGGEKPWMCAAFSAVPMPSKHSA